MGLIGRKTKENNKRKQKVKMPDTLIFEHFAENKVANKLRIDADCKKFQKDFLVYSFDRNIRALQSDFKIFNDNMKNYLLNATGSTVFADNLVAMSNVAKGHAAFYVYTDKARTKNEIKNAYLNLRKLYDIMIFITMDHIMFEKGEYIEWQEDGFHHLVDTKNEDLILMMTDVLNNIIMLADALYDGDNTAVYNALQFFSDENFYKIKLSSEKIFKL